MIKNSYLGIFPPHDHDQYLTKHEKLLEVLESTLRNQWQPHMSPNDLEHNINEIMRVVRYNRKIKALLDDG
jgi:hypothetical protein